MYLICRHNLYIIIENVFEFVVEPTNYIHSNLNGAFNSLFVQFDLEEKEKHFILIKLTNIFPISVGHTIKLHGRIYI